MAQPPSGGCVLKRYSRNTVNQHDTPAAFGRLCVETPPKSWIKPFGNQPPSGGCVLKQRTHHLAKHIRHSSRLRAAVC